MNRSATGLRACLLAGTILAMAAPLAAHAADAAEAPSRLDNSTTIDEVVVTAQKREQNLRDVPISITAISGNSIVEKANYSFYDLAKVAPGVNTVPTGDNLHSKNSIRGVSSYANDIGQQSPIGIFIDGIFMARTAIGTSQDFVDLERVEILRGPQGTLFGMNTSAGLIHFVTRKPDLNEFNGYAEAMYGSYNTFNTRATVSMPLVAGKLAASLAFYHDYHDGYDYDPILKKDADNLNKTGIKGKLRFDTGNFDGVLTVDYEGEKSICCSALITKLLPGANSLGIPTAPLAPPDYPHSRQTIQNALDTNPSHQYGVTSDLNWHFGDFTLTSLTGFRYWTGAPFNDVDILSLHLIDDYLLDQTHQQFSQEIRLTSPAGQKLEYILGAFYYYRNSKDHESLSLGSDVPAAFKVPGTDFATINDSRINDSTYAVFAHVDYHVTDQLTLSGGARYTREPQQADFRQTSNNFAYPNLGSFTESRDDKKFTWMVDASYKWTPHITTYATVSTGFTPGGFDVLQRKNFIGFTFKPETDTNYEVGIKSSLLDGRATLTADVFHMVYKDFQTQAFNGLNLTTANAGSFVSQGVEIEGEIRPVEGLTLTANGAYIDAHYTDFKEGQCPLGVAGAFCDLSGFQLFNAPKYTFNGSIKYEHPVAQNWDGYARADISYRSKIYFSQNLNPNAVQEGYATVDGAIGVKSADGTTVELWGKNLFDKDYLSYSFPTAFSTGVYGGYLGAPRVIGVRVGKLF